MFAQQIQNSLSTSFLAVNYLDRTLSLVQEGDTLFFPFGILSFHPARKHLVLFATHLWYCSQSRLLAHCLFLSSLSPAVGVGNHSLRVCGSVKEGNISWPYLLVLKTEVLKDRAFVFS